MLPQVTNIEMAAVYSVLIKVQIAVWSYFWNVCSSKYFVSICYIDTQNIHCNISKYITHSMIFFTTHYIINITHDCSVQINTILFTFLFTLVKISHSTTAITLEYTKCLECTQFCNIFCSLHIHFKEIILWPKFHYQLQIKTFIPTIRLVTVNNFSELRLQCSEI
jgi:hypothetical protein